MTFALVGLAAGLGACYPRFQAENVTQVAGSFGGVAFMVLAVLFTVVVVGLVAWPASTYIWYDARGLAPAGWPGLWPWESHSAWRLVLCWLRASLAMRRGVRALEEMG